MSRARRRSGRGSADRQCDVCSQQGGRGGRTTQPVILPVCEGPSAADPAHIRPCTNVRRQDLRSAVAADFRSRAACNTDDAATLAECPPSCIMAQSPHSDATVNVQCGHVMRYSIRRPSPVSLQASECPRLGQMHSHLRSLAPLFVRSAAPHHHLSLSFAAFLEHQTLVYISVSLDRRQRAICVAPI